MPIHPTAIIDPDAKIDPSAQIDAYAVIERDVQIGAGTRVWSHAYIAEGTRIGQRCHIHPHAVVGHWPQDLKWTREPSYTEIGDETIIREFANVHRGTTPGTTTKIGRRCYLMTTAHVGHNCDVGDEVIIAGTVAGHVSIGRKAFVSGGVLVHQFVRLGEFVMVGGGGKAAVDVPPFMTITERNYVVGPNTIGLRRAGFSSAERLEIRECHRLLYRSGLHLPVAIDRIASLVATDPGRRLLEFLRAPSKRGYYRRRREDAENGAGDESAAE